MGSKISLVLLTINLVLLTDGGRAVFSSAVGNHHQHQVYVVSCMYWQACPKSVTQKKLATMHRIYWYYTGIITNFYILCEYTGIITNFSAGCLPYIDSTVPLRITANGRSHAKAALQAMPADAIERRRLLGRHEINSEFWST